MLIAEEGAAMARREFEPMSVGQILDRTFRLYREDFVHFVTIVAVVQVPLGLVGLLLQRLGPYGFARRGQAGAAGEQLLLFIAASLGAAFIYAVAASLLRGALVKSVSESYLGNDVSVGQAYRFVLPKVGSLLWASILVGVICMIGYMLLIVPGVIFSLWLMLTTPAIVVEGRTASRALGRSKALTGGNLGKVFGVALIVFLIGIAFGLVFNFAGGFIGVLASRPGSLAYTVVTQGFSVAGQVLMAPIGAIAVILLYYDLRIRKEGFDLEMLAQSMGAKEA
jgi:hypothetical protein